MKSLYKEFKEFAIKGNMIDIAIGVIIGAAFNKVVDILVKEIFLPPLSFLTDGKKWEGKKIILQGATAKMDEIAIGYGKLLGASIDFIIIGFTVFIIVKVMNTMKNKAQDPKDKSTPTPKDIELLNKISELLEQQIELTKNSNK